MERAETLDAYLSGLRKASGLSVDAVCQRTKIQARFVEALEAGRWDEVPSNTHVRAFSVAMAKACGADGARASELALQTLAATAPLPTDRPEHGFDTPAPSPILVRDAAGSAVPAYAAAGATRGAAPASDSSLAAASARFRSLPVGVLLAFLALAGALSYTAAWSVQRWHQREIASILGAQALPAAAPQAASPAGPLAQPATAAPKVEDLSAKPAASSPAAGALASTAAGATAVAAPTLQLVLRARRPCWLVLDIDGKRLPTVTMQDGDKLRWDVTQRAVLLAGNVGALRVWWQGDNLGYLGSLDQRANALVFERGHEPRKDASAALPLPAGIE